MDRLPDEMVQLVLPASAVGVAVLNTSHDFSEDSQLASPSVPASFVVQSLFHTPCTNLDTE